MVIEALDRWGHAPRRWQFGELTEASIPAERDRLAVALDALLENAIARTDAGHRIELSARIQDGQAGYDVADCGCGIPEADLERIFARFARQALPRPPVRRVRARPASHPGDRRGPPRHGPDPQQPRPRLHVRAADLRLTAGPGHARATRLWLRLAAGARRRLLGRRHRGTVRPVLLLLGGGFAGGEPFDDAELEPVALLDLESRGLDVAQRTAGEVLAL
jgi:histidine kinase/DNA gyrase B/HSP90-like ATPase